MLNDEIKKKQKKNLANMANSWPGLWDHDNLIKKIIK